MLKAFFIAFEIFQTTFFLVVFGSIILALLAYGPKLLQFVFGFGLIYLIVNVVFGPL